MDVHYFLSQRLKFIEQFYEGASGPFRETARQIEEYYASILSADLSADLAKARRESTLPKPEIVNGGELA